MELGTAPSSAYKTLCFLLHSGWMMRRMTTGTYTTPVIQSSTCPGLLGMGTLQLTKAIIDTFNKKVYFVGDGDVNIILPPGSRAYGLEQTPSGHLVLPITDYAAARKSIAHQQQGGNRSTNLHARTVVNQGTVNPCGTCAAGSGYPLDTTSSSL